MILSPSPSLVQAADVAKQSLWRDARERSTRVLDTLRHQDRSESRVQWRVENINLHGRNFRYRVTTNDQATPGEDEQIWAINLHGYFAGGSMYARESEQLARRLGWRVVNPSLPGFGGSDPLREDTVTIDCFSEHVDVVRRELGIERFVLLGHSMGGAVAIQYASRHPQNVVGVIYRDGVATPEWQRRDGWTTHVLGQFFPRAAPVVNLAAAVALDTPDLLIGHMFRTISALVPDLARNIKDVAHSTPVARMLMNLDLTDHVRNVAAHDIPVYVAWGCFDRVVTSPAATSFAHAANAPVQWVPGGHSWMLARPSGQSDLLTENEAGRRFVQRLRVRDLELRLATS